LLQPSPRLRPAGRVGGLSPRSPDFKRFLTIANASAYEVRSQIRLAGRLGYLGALETEMIVKDCEEISRMLIGLKRKIHKF
jgi:four helix bundle protein